MALAISLRVDGFGACADLQVVVVSDCWVGASCLPFLDVVRPDMPVVFASNVFALDLTSQAKGEFP